MSEKAVSRGVLGARTLTKSSNHFLYFWTEIAVCFRNGARYIHSYYISENEVIIPDRSVSLSVTSSDLERRDGTIVFTYAIHLPALKIFQVSLEKRKKTQAAC